MKNAVRALLVFLVVCAVAFSLLAFDVHSFPSDASGFDADAAIVLGASIDGDRPSPAFRGRIEHAVRLLRTGQVRWIILTGGRPDGCATAEAVVAKRYAIECGAPEETILAETQSHTTYQNLHQARTLAQSHGFKTLVVVSDPYHLRRAMRMAEELGLDARASGTPASTLNTSDFLLRETWRNAVFLVRHWWSADAEANELAVDAH